MQGGEFVRSLEPYSAVIVAAGPFVAAIAIRLAGFRSRRKDALLAITTFWLLVSVMVAPHAESIRRWLYELEQQVR